MSSTNEAASSSKKSFKKQLRFKENVSFTKNKNSLEIKKNKEEIKNSLPASSRDGNRTSNPKLSKAHEKRKNKIDDLMTANTSHYPFDQTKSNVLKKRKENVKLNINQNDILSDYSSDSDHFIGSQKYSQRDSSSDSDDSLLDNFNEADYSSNVRIPLSEKSSTISKNSCSNSEKNVYKSRDKNYLKKVGVNVFFVPDSYEWPNEIISIVAKLKEKKTRAKFKSYLQSKVITPIFEDLDEAFTKAPGSVVLRSIANQFAGQFRELANYYKLLANPPPEQKSFSLAELIFNKLDNKFTNYNKSLEDEEKVLRLKKASVSSKLKENYKCKKEMSNNQTTDKD